MFVSDDRCKFLILWLKLFRHACRITWGVWGLTLKNSPRGFWGRGDFRH